jgi:hypothetical protein
VKLDCGKGSGEREKKLKKIVMFFCDTFYLEHSFLGEIAKIAKIASSCLSVYPSVRPHGTTGLLLDGFSLNLIF